MCPVCVCVYVVLVKRRNDRVSFSSRKQEKEEKK